ncbi:MAG: hypothetical protein PWR13_65 [Archaeoglobi archaeon]|nr:hypothetical protein [Candidatus Mnemosynella bozhongmuii]MDI3502385.1 hypothetical protein [Archaeoglobi archaeon]MDK2781037.1 hypothetical protein [Archaeoglobi archaeon]
MNRKCIYKVAKCIRISLMMFLIASAVTGPCLADVIPVPPPPVHVKIIQLAVPILINYLWNFVILGAIFSSFGIRVRSRRFFLFILVLTLTGLIIDVVTLILAVGATITLKLNLFFEWIFIVGFLLFLLSFSLTRLFYKLPRRKSIISGLAYAVLSHPIIGITFIIPLLAKFNLVPPLKFV